MVACELHLWSSQCAKCHIIHRHRTTRHRRAPVRNALRGRTCHNTSVYVIPQMLQLILHIRGVVLPRILKALMFSALVFGQSQFSPFKEPQSKIGLSSPPGAHVTLPFTIPEYLGQWWNRRKLSSETQTLTRRSDRHTLLNDSRPVCSQRTLDVTYCRYTVKN